MSTVKAVFEGVRGKGIQGDIAIDDITVLGGSCGAGAATGRLKCLLAFLIACKDWNSLHGLLK